MIRLLGCRNFCRNFISPTAETLIITVFPAEKGEFTLYEDDGISRDFENGAFLKTHLTYQNQNGEITVTITPEGKGYQGMSAKRDYIIELPSSEKALSLTEGDGTVLFENGKNIITLPKCDIQTALKIKLK